MNTRYQTTVQIKNEAEKIKKQKKKQKALTTENPTELEVRSSSPEGLSYSVPLMSHTA